MKLEGLGEKMKKRGKGKSWKLHKKTDSNVLNFIFSPRPPNLSKLGEKWISMVKGMIKMQNIYPCKDKNYKQCCWVEAALFFKALSSGRNFWWLYFEI